MGLSMRERIVIACVAAAIALFWAVTYLVAPSKPTEPEPDLYATATGRLTDCRRMGGHKCWSSRRDGNAPIWRSRDAMQEGARLTDLGVHERNPEKVMPFMSCLVPIGTAFNSVSTDGGEEGWTYPLALEVVIAEGAHKGCRGFVNYGDHSRDNVRVRR